MTTFEIMQSPTLRLNTSFRDDDDIFDATRSLAKASLSVFVFFLLILWSNYSCGPTALVVLLPVCSNCYVVHLPLWFSRPRGPVSPVLYLLYGPPARVVQAPRLARSDLCQSPEFIFFLIHECFKKKLLKTVPLSLSVLSPFYNFFICDIPCIVAGSISIHHAVANLECSYHMYCYHYSNIIFIVLCGKTEYNSFLLLFANNNNNNNNTNNNELCEARDSGLTQFVDENQISEMIDMLCTK